MPFTDGVYAGISNSFNNAVARTVIDPADFNDLFTDIETAFNDVSTGAVYKTTDVASASTCNIGAAATSVVRITGTTTITSLGTSANRLRFVFFAASLTLTHNATTLILPNAANIITAAGDSATFISDASGNWRCLSYTRRTGPNFATYSALQAATAGNHDLVYVYGRTSAGDGGEGMFRWLSGNQSALVTADTAKGLYVAPTSDTSGASGVWARLTYGQPYNVKWFGATGDGTTEDTTALQAAITAAEAITYATLGNSHGAIFIPTGLYITAALTNAVKIAIRGAGRTSSTLRMKTGTTAALLTINAENVAATTVDDANHTIIEDLGFEGNRTDSTTQTGYHGISCPAPAWSLTTQYSPSFVGNRLQIQNFSGHGIALGDNRNWMLLSQSIIRYNNNDGLNSSGFDHRITDCDFGIHTGYGVRLVAGGGVAMSGVNCYYNEINLVINPGVVSPCFFTNCDFSAGNTYGVTIENSSEPDGHTIMASRFSTNSRSAANTYSDILVSSAERLAVIGCTFIYASQAVKYLVDNVSSTQVYWFGNQYTTSGNVPYGTAAFSNNAQIFFGGDSSVGLYKTGTSSLGVNGPFGVKSYTVAGLPTGAAGDTAYASNGRKNGEGVGSGTGVLVFKDGTAWRACDTGATVAA